MIFLVFSKYNMVVIPKLIRLIGLILDIAGTIVIVQYIISSHISFTNIKSLEELEKKLQSSNDITTYNTSFGIMLIIMGFILIFLAELWELGLMYRDNQNIFQIETS